MGFVYRDDRRKAHFTDAELLRGLRGFSRVCGGRGFTFEEFDAWEGRAFSPTTVLRRFGSWQAALSRAGVKGGRPKEYSAAELVEEFERVWREIGRRPGSGVMARRGRYSLTPYMTRWGSVKRLGELVKRHQRGEISRAELLRGVPRARRRARQRVMTVNLRWRVLKRDRYRCVACGRNPARDSSVELQVDHIVPVSKGGGNEVGNLRTLCRECNLGKGSRDLGNKGARD